MDLYANTLGEGQRQYDPTVAECPANALDAIADTLGEMECRVRETGQRASAIVGRVFGEPTSFATGSKGESAVAPREPASIPALNNRIERIHGLFSELESAIARLSSL